MEFIDELVDYFADLLTEEQKQKINELWHPAPAPDDDDEYDSADDDNSDHGDDGSRYPYEEYDTLYDSPAKKGKAGHAAGKRRPLRHPAVTAEGLVALFQKEAKKIWKSNSFTLELYLALAAVHDPAYLTGKRRGAGQWRRFILAVESLKDLDADSLAGLLARLSREMKDPSNPRSNDLFKGIFYSFAEGSFSDLANRFCRQKISGIAGRAVLADLRDITYPEGKRPPSRTRTYISFLDNADLTAVFDYYRIQRKLEYILKQTVAEALQRVFKNHLPEQ